MFCKLYHSWWSFTDWPHEPSGELGSYSERTSNYDIIYRTLHDKPVLDNYPFYPIDCFWFHNIAIFYTLTSSGPRGRCWNPSQKSMFDRYYCIKHLFRSKTLEKLLRTVLYTCAYSGAETQVTCERFENAASRPKTNVIATVHFTDDDVSFYDGPGMLIRITALTARELPR